MASLRLRLTAAALISFTLSVGSAKLTRAGGLIPAESAVASSYKDTGLVSSHALSVNGMHVHYLSAGPEASKAKRVVMFCHGAAFTSHTWQITGVLDELGSQGFAAVALDLPGYGQSEALKTSRLATADHQEPDRSTFLTFFAKALGISTSARIVVVSASMGGSFAAPFAMHPSPFVVSGYVTVAGNLPTSLGVERLADVPPLLAIFGSEDPRLLTDRSRYESAFPRRDIVVFEGAPHPAYLRDRAAANLFTDLVLQFCGGRSSTQVASSLTSLQEGVKIETTYYRGTFHSSSVPATITKVYGDATYALKLDDGDVEARVPQKYVTSLEYARQAKSQVLARHEVMPALKRKATW